MMYGAYKNSRNLSWNILIKEKIIKLPVNIIDLCRHMGIAVKYYESTVDNDGKSMILNGVPVILVDKKCSVQRQRFTVAHELGHILLGHVGKCALFNREPSSTDVPIEQAANIFASRLLAPACVLWGKNIHTASEISDLCGISRQSAEYRMERMNVLYQRNRFLTSPLERQVYEQFRPFIEDLPEEHRANL
jgi:predicted Zn peptidase|nr:MAG TPA: IrrE protein [Caudoviricetes sp.]